MEKPEHRPSGIGSGQGPVPGSGNHALPVVVNGDRDKKFACSHAGCEKRFTRAEHLHRHALNHTNGDHACPRCSAAFKRRDLLDRHMNRHRQKDLEAGGEGCGVLDTRKRAWKAPDGSVAERRPHSLGRVPARGRRGASGNSSRSEEARKRHYLLSAQSQTQPQPHYQSQTSQTKPPQALQQLPTSPTSERETDDSIFHVNGSNNHTGSVDININPLVDCHSAIQEQEQQPNQHHHHQLHQQQQQQQQHLESGPEVPAPQFDLFLNSLVPASYANEDPWQLWNEQPFQPDTASSFNMPYTTAIDYNWLFNAPRPVASEQPEQCNVFDSVSFANIMTPRSSSTITSTSIQPESLRSLGSISSGDGHDGRRFHRDHDGEPGNFRSPNLGINHHQTAHQQVQPVSPKSVNSSSTSNSLANSMTNNTAHNTHSAAAESHFVGDVASRNSSIQYASHSTLSNIERPLSRLDSTAHLPIIDGITHDRVLTVIGNAKPCLPDNPVFSLKEHPLLSQTAMQSYLDHFFTRFNVAYPIIHTALFDPSTAEPLLLLSIILLGATYATKDAHQVAVCIHDVIRPSVFAHEGFSARPALWTLQTILLVECFGKSRAGQKQHDMSHLFHGLLINLIRRSDCQSVRPTGPPPLARSRTVEQHARAVEQAWQRWAEAEQKKRLALYCFMWDTQHAVLFCQSLCMSAFELRLNFPCNQQVWEAEDANSWEKAWWATTPPSLAQIRGETGTSYSRSHPQPHSQTQPFYLPTLRAYLTPNGPPAPSELNLHGRVLVLHGLMSIFWDMQRRDQTSLGASVGSVPGGSNWRQMISAAYGHWKKDFDSYCSAQLALIPQQHQQQQYQSSQTGPQTDLAHEISAFASSANAVYHAAQCLLRMEFLDIQIYAGARSILGRPVQQRDYLRSAQVVKSWASASALAVDPDSTDNDGASMTDRSQTPSSNAPVGANANSNTTAMMSTPSRNAVSSGSDATGAVWHAARMLRDVVPGAESDAISSLFHVPWCLYLATLTCWAFYHASPKGGLNGLNDSEFDSGGFDMDHDMQHDGEIDTDEMVWDSRAEMQTLIAGLTASPDAPLRLGQRHRRTLTQRRINGLVWVMADTLAKVRWGIVHAGVIVLRGLVPARLINQYEADE